MNYSYEKSMKTIDDIYTKGPDFFFLCLPISVARRICFDFDFLFHEAFFQRGINAEKDKGRYRIIRTDSHILYTMPNL